MTDSSSLPYYYSWGPSRSTDSPGMSDRLHEANVQAFIEDKTMLEAQYQRLKERPDGNEVDIAQDAGGGKMLWVLDKLLKQEALAASERQLVAQ
jgi:vanillate O-demethylase oxygenase-like protein